MKQFENMVATAFHDTITPWPVRSERGPFGHTLTSQASPGAFDTKTSTIADGPLI